MTDPSAITDRFIIWGLSRSGTSTLYHSLLTRLRYPVGWTEPLVDGGAFHFITRRFRRDGDAGALPALMAPLVGCGFCMKHNIDSVPVAVTEALFDAVRGAGYRHVFLHRMPHAERLASYHYALHARDFGTRGWSDDPDRQARVFDIAIPARAVATRQIAHVRLHNALYDRLRDAGAPVLSLSHDDLYRATLDRRRRAWHALLAHLDLPADLIDPDADLDEDRPKARAALRARYRSFPGFDDLERLLAACPDYRVDDPFAQGG